MTCKIRDFEGGFIGVNPVTPFPHFKTKLIYRCQLPSSRLLDNNTFFTCVAFRFHKYKNFSNLQIMADNNQKCTSETGDCKLTNKTIVKSCRYHRNLYFKNQKKKTRESKAAAKRKARDLHLCDSCVNKKTTEYCSQCRPLYYKMCRKNTLLNKLSGKYNNYYITQCYSMKG